MSAYAPVITPPSVDQTNAAATYSNVTAKLAEVSACLAPNISVDGVTIDRMGYYKTLIDMQKLAREQMLAANGPFTITSVAR